MYTRKLKKITLACALTMLSTSAAKAVTALVVKDSEDQETLFLLTDKPVVTFDEDYLIITTDGTKVYYPLSAYRSFSIEDKDDTGVTAQEAVKPEFSFGDDVQALGLAANLPLQIYSADGRLVSTGKTNAEGKVHLEINGSKCKVLIFKAGKQLFKFINH